MTVIGYARVSTTDQNLDVQESALRAAGCPLIRSEKRSGTTTTGREELRTVLDFLRSGDVLMVTRIDRLARSIGDLQDIVRSVKAKGASLKATEQPIDTSTAAGKAFLDMPGVYAGIESPREAGVFSNLNVHEVAERNRQNLFSWVTGVVNIPYLATAHS